MTVEKVLNWRKLVKLCSSKDAKWNLTHWETAYGVMMTMHDGMTLISKLATITMNLIYWLLFHYVVFLIHYSFISSPRNTLISSSSSYHVKTSQQRIDRFLFVRYACRVLQSRSTKSDIDRYYIIYLHLFFSQTLVSIKYDIDIFGSFLFSYVLAEKMRRK